MQIVTFTTHEKDGWQTPRAGVILNSQYLLDFERVIDDAQPPPNHLAWLDMDGPWFQKAREIYEVLKQDSEAATQATAPACSTTARPSCCARCRIPAS